MGETGPSQAPPVTVEIRTGWRRRLSPRRSLRRVRQSTMAIVQIVVAATAAYAFALYVLGHPAPLLAATVTLSSLGLVRDARPVRVLETVIGMLVGILIAEVLHVLIGAGWWQMGLALAATLVVARFLSPHPSFAIAAGLQSIIVMSLPAAAPFERLADGAVGGIAALLVTALIPRTARTVELADGRRLLAGIDSAMGSLVLGLRYGSREHSGRGLDKARSLQTEVDAWREALDAGTQIARISPFLRRQRAELARHARILQAMDFASRNLRVVARRSTYLCEDGAPRPTAAETLEQLRHATRLIGDALEDISLEPVAREAVLVVARRLDPASMLPAAKLGDQNLVGALRPLAVDLLQATGMDAAEARRAVPRI